MHPVLEDIVSADEEARSRVALEEERRERELAAGRAERDASISARRREATDAFDHEMEAIRAEGDARVGELQRQQTEYLATLARTSESRLDEAVALYLRIVCEVES